MPSLIAVLALFGGSVASAQDLTFTPSADAAVLRENPTLNYADAPLSVEWEKFSIGEAVRRSFIRFSTTGVESLAFDCLTLKLTASPLGGGTTHFEVRQVTNADWEENGISWTSQPNLGGVIGNWTRGAASGEAIYIPLDVNALRTSGNFDIALVGHTYGGTSRIEFDSREGAHPPELILGCSGIPLRAGFAIRMPEGPAPLEISFENVSHGMATSWTWDFGDGGASTEESPTYTYTTPGRYTVSLTVTDASGSDTHVRENYVFAHPVDTPLGELVSWGKISEVSGGNTPVLEDQDMFGRSVANLGDLDGDGVFDLIVGAVGDDDAELEGGGDLPGTLDDNRGFNPGGAYILFMNADGSVRDHQKISNLYGGLQEELEDIDGFGRYVAGIGDLDGDGIVDAAIAATRDDDGGIDQGAIYILFLNADGTIKAETKISETSGGWTADLDPDDQIGRGITSLGDLDGDGVQDLATGATGDDDGGIDRGCVYILFMNRDGTVKHTQKISALEGGLTTSWVGFWFGMDVDSMGDVDGDGVTDLAVGVLLEQAVPAASGAAFVLLLNADGTVKGESFINAFNGLLPGELEADDEFGGAVAGIGDLDGDGIPDLAVGSIRDDDNEKGELEITLDYGAVYVFFLNADATVREYQKISQTRGGFDVTLDKFVRVAEGMGAAGDFDGDGWPELWAGSRFDRDGGPNNGAVYHFRMRGSSLAPIVAGLQAGPTSGEVPLTVGFYDRSSGVVNSWSWDFGDGASSVQQNPVHEYTTPGTYTVTLTTSGAAGSDTQSDVVVVHPPAPPAAAFGLAPSSGPAPLQVAFSDTSSGTVTAWSWDFGDGQSSTLENPTHTYDTMGTYSVQLSVTGPMGTNALLQEDVVVVGLPAAPIAAFTATLTSGDLPLAVGFTDASTGMATSWLWDFGDGSTSSAQNPTHVYVVPGTYDVSLTATGPGGGHSVTQPGYVTVTGSVGLGLADGGFEAQIGGMSPLAPWTVLAGTAHRIAPLVQAEDGSMPSEGLQWLEVSAQGSLDAIPPTIPGGVTTPARGASGVGQAFRLPAGQTRLAFEAAFLLAGPAASSDFNDWMSVDVSDGTRTLNVYYADSFTPLPEVSLEHGLPMTATAQVRVDLVHAFPEADENTVFTLQILVGNGGDGAGDSIGRVDGFRLETSDPSIERIGCGLNPLGSLLVLAGTPMLGSSMRYGLDNPLGTQNIGAFPAFFVAVTPDVNHPCGTSVSGIGMAGGPGEILFGLQPSDIVGVFGGSTWGGVGSPSVVDVSLPNMPSLTGLTVYVQGMLYDPSPGAPVRIGMTDGLELSLSLLPPSGLSNLATGKSATQSSDFGGMAEASRAIDGSINGDFMGDSVSHTLQETDPYWEVDLENVQPIEWIDIWNRTDCCQRRLENAYVFVSDVPFVSTVPGEVLSQAGVYSYQLTSYHDTYNRIPVGRTGRYVRVQQSGQRFVQLAEVEVLGYTTPGRVRVAGLEAQYFDDMELTSLVLERTDANVDFDFALDGPVPEIGADTFSVRWRGFVLPSYDETYTFTLESTDGARLWVDGQLVIDAWFDRSFGESSGTIELTADAAVPIVLEYFENTGDAVVRFFWQSDTVEKEIVPAAALSRWAD